LALANVLPDMVDKSVALTNRASVSVTGGVDILFSCEMGVMKVSYPMHEAIDNRRALLVRGIPHRRDQFSKEKFTQRRVA
jgi:hypothetical protein